MITSRQRNESSELNKKIKLKGKGGASQLNRKKFHLNPQDEIW